MPEWTIDPMHTDVSFTIKHFGIMNLRGSFGQVVGTAQTDDTNTLKSVLAKIDVKSLSTRNDERNAHILSDAFFDAETFPEITFTSRIIEKLSENIYEVVGDLTIKGITQEVALDVRAANPIQDPFGLQRIGLEIQGQIDRRDFGMDFNQVLDNGGLFIGNKVTITIDSEMTCKVMEAVH